MLGPAFGKESLWRNPRCAFLTVVAVLSFFSTASSGPDFRVSSTHTPTLSRHSLLRLRNDFTACLYLRGGATPDEFPDSDTWRDEEEATGVDGEDAEEEQPSLFEAAKFKSAKEEKPADWTGPRLRPDGTLDLDWDEGLYTSSSEESYSSDASQDRIPKVAPREESSDEEGQMLYAKPVENIVATPPQPPFAFAVRCRVLTWLILLPG